MRKHTLVVTVLLAGAASPALAALPRLTDSNADYLLMPLLGYVGLIIGARGGQMIKRRILRKRK